GATGLVVLWRHPRSFIHVLFSVGMVLFAGEALSIGFIAHYVSPENLLFWEKVKFFISSLLSGIWLIFGLAFARSNSDCARFLSRWKWALSAYFVAVPTGVVLLWDNLLVGDPIFKTSSIFLFRLGWAGFLLHVVFLIITILILMNLERTLRNAKGRVRWQIKFMVLGLGGLFGVRLYTDSQVVLFRVLNTNFDVVDIAALLVACIMMMRSLTRTKVLEFDFYLSHAVLYNSFTVLVVGIYFVVVGLVARLSYEFQVLADPSLISLVVLVAILAFAVFILSDKLRYRRKKFISRHFKRPVYDYQKVWAGFTENTASLTSIKDLCLAVTTLVSHTCDVLAVSLWVIDDQQDKLSLAHSTMLSENQGANLDIRPEFSKDLIALLKLRSVPVDLAAPSDEAAYDLYQIYQAEFEMLKTQYCVPLRAAGKLIGVVTLGKKVMNQPLSFEDYELLRTIGDQVAASLLNLKLSEKLRQAKELEAFQVMSAFFMHDLKNLASKLSLVSQNMPVHFKNEEFRQDASQTMSQCVEKIKGMCNRLSLLSQTLQLEPREVDLNKLAARTLEGMNGQLMARVTRNLGKLPPLMLDDEQMEKVLLNLLLNANEAAGGDGRIELSTSHNQSQDWVEVRVSDNGCGMSREFMEKYLFKPFQTTKQQGMGIGLFHCKTIVEAHGGKIEVESTEGVGTTFRVLLPTGYGRV
ncbi:MAG TPA: PEP-CTERM system histidine kinase PrsK, partial [Deltaproteobacteria bacterium]|nr:PEP-CTERM system histidine kinase PrsK [Deltaproteobacteria bacterium]